VSWWALDDGDAEMVVSAHTRSGRSICAFAPLSERSVRTVSRLFPRTVEGVKGDYDEQAAALIAVLACGAYSVETGCHCDVEHLRWWGICERCGEASRRGQRLFRFGTCDALSTDGVVP
jgi:hypothetical protein